MATQKVKINLKPPQQGSSSVISLPQPPLRNSEEFLKAYIGYVYTAVGAIAQEVASIDLHLYQVRYVGGKPTTKEIYEHEALSLLHYVNRISTLYDLIEATQTYLELTGEAFWVVIREGGQVNEIWPLRPDWIRIIPSKTEFIDHYVYYAGGVMSEAVQIPKENMIPFKYFNPLNPYRGKGTTQAAALPFDILNYAQEYNRNFFFNSAIPSMVFTSEQSISEQTVKKFLTQWQSSFGGRSKSNKIAFLGKGMKVDKTSFASKELDFTEQMKQMRDDVLAVFKVPKSIIGITDDVNRANADSTKRAFMERVITPRMRKLVDSINEFYLPLFVGDSNDLFFDFTDPSPEDVEIKLKRYENGRQNNWLTPNEIRIEENLEPIEGGDDLFKAEFIDPNAQNNQNDGKESKPKDDNNSKPTEDSNKGVRASIIKMLGGEVKKKKYIPTVKERPIKHMVRIPVKTPTKLKTEQLTQKFIGPLKEFISELISSDDYSPLLKKKVQEEPKKIEELTKQKLLPTKIIKTESGWNEEQKTAYWIDFIKKVTVREKHIKEVCQDVFAKQEALVIENLDNTKSYKKSSASTVVPSIAEMNAMWDNLSELLKDMYIEQAENVLQSLDAGDTINITSEFATQYLIEYGGTLINQINDTTRQALMDNLSAGYDAGESIEDLKKRVQEVFTQASDTRAEMIARTESLKASNSASVEAYRQSGVVKAKEWLAERDARTCPFCLKQDGKFTDLNKNFFEEGDTITEGGQTLTIQFTNVGEPPLHVDCRCTTIPVILEAAAEEKDKIASKVEELHGKAVDQNSSFQESAEQIAEDLDAELRKGPVKTLDRLLEKVFTEYFVTEDPVSNLMDANRSTILILDPADLQKVVDAVKDEFGDVVRVKDKFHKPGYKSAIINVVGEEGVVSEIAVTTPEMWEAKTTGGGDKMYNIVRTGKDATGKVYEEMMQLYQDAQDAIDARLGK